MFFRDITLPLETVFNLFIDDEAFDILYLIFETDFWEIWTSAQNLFVTGTSSNSNANFLFLNELKSHLYEMETRSLDLIHERRDASLQRSCKVFTRKFSSSLSLSQSLVISIWFLVSIRTKSPGSKRKLSTAHTMLEVKDGSQVLARRRINGDRRKLITPDSRILMTSGNSIYLMESI